MIPLEVLDDADSRLDVIRSEIKGVRELLGPEHMVSNSYLAQAFADIYHAQMSIAAEMRGRQRLGETG